MSTYALAVPEYAPRPVRYGTRAQLAAASGDVEGYLALAGCDKRAGTASYALRIVNQSDQSLRARMTCKTMRGESVLAYPLDVHIAPFSISETLLPVRLCDVGPYDRAVVCIEGGAVAFSLEAPAPERSEKRSRWLAGIAAGALLTLGSAFAAASSTPHIALLDAPARTFAGTSIDVPYAFGGWATMEYALQTRDGRRLDAGFAGAHEGTLHFSVPASAGPDVQLSTIVSGPFGRIAQVRHIAIAAAPPARKPATGAVAAPRISAFAISSTSVHAGDTLRVSYITNARDGEVWLIDDSGELWARQALSADGTTWLKVPPAAAGRQMRVVLHARSGAADQVAAAQLTVLPGDVVAASTASDAQQGGSAAMTLSPSQVAPGEQFTVTVDGAHTDALVTLTDASGNQIEQGDIPADQSAVTLSAPSSAKAASYYVTANISQGVGQQTLVRKLTVSPAN